VGAVLAGVGRLGVNRLAADVLLVEVAAQTSATNVQCLALAVGGLREGRGGEACVLVNGLIRSVSLPPAHLHCR
jgi:hypothetical protein